MAALCPDMVLRGRRSKAKVPPARGRSREVASGDASSNRRLRKKTPDGGGGPAKRGGGGSAKRFGGGSAKKRQQEVVKDDGGTCGTSKSRGDPKKGGVRQKKKAAKSGGDNAEKVEEVVCKPVRLRKQGGDQVVDSKEYRCLDCQEPVEAKDRWKSVYKSIHTWCGSTRSRAAQALKDNPKMHRKLIKLRKKDPMKYQDRIKDLNLKANEKLTPKIKGQLVKTLKKEFVREKSVSADQGYRFVLIKTFMKHMKDTEGMGAKKAAQKFWQIVKTPGTMKIKLGKNRWRVGVEKDPELNSKDALKLIGKNNDPTKGFGKLGDGFGKFSDLSKFQMSKDGGGLKRKALTQGVAFDADSDASEADAGAAEAVSDTEESADADAEENFQEEDGEEEMMEEGEEEEAEAVSDESDGDIFGEDDHQRAKEAAQEARKQRNRSSAITSGQSKATPTKAKLKSQEVIDLTALSPANAEHRCIVFSLNEEFKKEVGEKMETFQVARP